MITNIDIKRLRPHPGNPRKDLGDLKELTESIKAQGVLQNLTVVPTDPAGTSTDYTVVVGHRRLAAGQLAGMTELPCVVTDMDYKTQIATMLTENIQRSDLTLLEEADGFQMMLDLGESIKDISDKTGLSETTVRRRVKIVSEFDREALRRVQNRPIKLDDYEKLYKITDAEKRAEVFEKIGTHEFDWAYAGAISQQERSARRLHILEMLSGFAQEVPYGEMQSANILKRWDFYRHEPGDVDEVKGLATEHDVGTEYFYTSTEYGGTIVFIKDGDKAAAAEKNSAKNTKREAKIAKLKDVFIQAYTLRVDFAKEFRATAKMEKAVENMAIDALFYGHHFDEEEFRRLLGIEKKFRQSWESPEKGETKDEALARLLSEKVDEPRNNMFIGAYCRLESKTVNCYDHSGNYVPNKMLSLLYDHLIILGYVMSSDETALLDGTHDLYAYEE